MKRTGLFLILMAIVAAVSAQVAPLEMSWDKLTEGSKNAKFVITLKNVSDSTLRDNWTICIASQGWIRPVKGGPVIANWVNGTLYHIVPTEDYMPMAPGETVTYIYNVDGVTQKTFRLENPYMVFDGGKPMSVKYMAGTSNVGDLSDASSLSHYRDYSAIPAPDALAAWDIFPAVKAARPLKGAADLSHGYRLSAPAVFAGEADILREKLAAFGINENRKSGVKIAFERLPKAKNDEYYTLRITKNAIVLRAATPEGAFNAAQTLIGLLKSNDSKTLAAVEIEDWPDFAYRGVHLDIARNFTPYGYIRRLIDIFSELKINKVQFHVTDDEGWRVEIPGIEELITVGSRRGYPADTYECLPTAYDNHYCPDGATTGNGYVTRGQFIDLIRYAAARHIELIPEIELPGHSKAAITAMIARYNKYRDTDSAKATEYLLLLPEDVSHNLSAQGMTNNVINVALPSARNFVKKVIAEIDSMYAEAGVPLRKLHIGGDEVCEDNWKSSPACLAYMKEHGLATPHQLSEDFFLEITEFMADRGIQYGCWQEVALNNRPETDRILASRAYGINAWATDPVGGNDVITYQMANNGYPVIGSGVTNLYFDMVCGRNPEEPGLNWGPSTDERMAFALQPFDIYRSARIDHDENLLDIYRAGDGKPQLSPETKGNIVGIQSQLWAEAIRSPQQFEYMLFPKVYGLAERAWNAHPSFEGLPEETEPLAYNAALARFYALIEQRELPYLGTRGVNYRVPYPGLKIENGTLRAACPYRLAEIRYTTDGTEPTRYSALYTAPVALPADCDVVKAKAFFGGKESVATALRNRK